MIPADLSGLTYLQKRATGELPDPPVFKTMAMRITHAKEGMVRIAAQPNRSHLNSSGIVQGGVTASILDAVTGFAIHSLLAPGFYVVTTGLELHFFKPVLVDAGVLTAEGRIVHLSRNIGVADGILIDAAGNKLAKATGTCMIVALRNQ